MAAVPHTNVSAGLGMALRKLTGAAGGAWAFMSINYLTRLGCGHLCTSQLWPTLSAPSLASG